MDEQPASPRGSGGLTLPEEAIIVKRVAASHINGMERDVAYALNHEGAIIKVVADLRSNMERLQESGKLRDVAMAGRLQSTYLKLAMGVIDSARDAAKQAAASPSIGVQVNTQINMAMVPDPERAAEMEARWAAIVNVLGKAAKAMQLSEPPGPPPPPAFRPAQPIKQLESNNGHGGNGSH